MTLYGGIDLHSNNVMISLIDAQDHLISEKRLPNELPLVEQAEGLYDSIHTDIIRFPDLVLLVV